MFKTIYFCQHFYKIRNLRVYKMIYMHCWHPVTTKTSHLHMSKAAFTFSGFWDVVQMLCSCSMWERKCNFCAGLLGGIAWSSLAGTNVQTCHMQVPCTCVLVSSLFLLTCMLLSARSPLLWIRTDTFRTPINSTRSLICYFQVVGKRISTAIFLYQMQPSTHSG